MTVYILYTGRRRTDEETNTVYSTAAFCVFIIVYIITFRGSQGLVPSHYHAHTIMASVRNRKFCDHCEQYVGYSTYYTHKLHFYDEATSRWSKKFCAEATEPDSELEDISDLPVNSDDNLSLSEGIGLLLLAIWV